MDVQQQQRLRPAESGGFGEGGCRHRSWRRTAEGLPGKDVVIAVVTYSFGYSNVFSRGTCKGVFSHIRSRVVFTDGDSSADEF
jgi:hypothetical protein